MIIDMNYWSKVLKKLLIFCLSILGIYLAFKLAIFYMPFLVAFILSLLIEPIIKFCMKHFKLKRRTSAIIVFILALAVIIGLLVWGIVSLISESSNLLGNINTYAEKISTNINGIINKIDLNKFHLSSEMVNVIQNSGNDILAQVTVWVRDGLTSILNFITSIPTIGIYTVISVLSLYFICVDKIYIIDQFEHHFPEIWVKKLAKHMKAIIKSLGNYLKAQSILILISFVICLIGLIIFKMVGLNVEFPLIAALTIGFVDALPIFGSATAMIPWAIISAINGDITLAIAIIVLLTIMSITKQIIEPKIVSGKLGIHPIFTLIAMYTGFKFIGVLGMLIGPIVLIILKNIYSGMIDKGFAKAIFDREI
ncbi:MAG: sporulation integral membrane protein YtvI [Clostridia bacterium]|nr:sporulation integral membrane protein YtvI [Clostridia bacterium]